MNDFLVENRIVTNFLLREAKSSRELGVMAVDWLSKVFDIGKLPTKVVALFAVVAAIVLFTPSDIQQRLHTKEVLEKHGWIVGVVFLACTGLLLFNTALYLAKLLRTAFASRRRESEIRRSLEEMDRVEIAVMREFLIEQRRTILAPMDEPSVASLLKKGILVRVGTLAQRSVAGVLVSVAPSEIANRFLDENSLGVSENLTQEEVEIIRESRPPFVTETLHLEAMRGGSRYLFRGL
jgi:hypothetical protein